MCIRDRLGIAAFAVFYFVFYFAIKKWDLKTPGREDDDDLEKEKSIELASDDYTAIAKAILEGCGGKDNITSIDNCVTSCLLYTSVKKENTVTCFSKNVKKIK